jgi:hypothetical protein
MRTFLSTLLVALLLAVSVQSFGVHTPVLSAAQSQVRFRFVDGKEMRVGASAVRLLWRSAGASDYFVLIGRFPLDIVDCLLGRRS